MTKNWRFIGAPPTRKIHKKSKVSPQNHFFSHLKDLKNDFVIAPRLHIHVLKPIKALIYIQNSNLQQNLSPTVPKNQQIGGWGEKIVQVLSYFM